MTFCMLVKTFLFVGRNTNIQFHKYSTTYYFTNILYVTYRFFANIYFSITSFNNIKHILDNTLCTYLYSTFYLVARFDMSANWLIKQGYLSSVNF